MTTEQDLVARAHVLAAEIAPRAPEIEAAGRIPPDLSRVLGEAGFYRLFLTEACGGFEVSPRTAAEVYEVLAQGDGACPRQRSSLRPSDYLRAPSPPVTIPLPVPLAPKPLQPPHHTADGTDFSIMPAGLNIHSTCINAHKLFCLA